MSRSTIAGVPLLSGPVAPTARGLDRNPISWSQHVAFSLREMRGRCDGGALADGNLVDRSRAAAEQARRSDPPVIHQERGFRLAAQQPDLVVDPEAAPMPPPDPSRNAKRSNRIG